MAHNQPNPGRTFNIPSRTGIRNERTTTHDPMSLGGDTTRPDGTSVHRQQENDPMTHIFGADIKGRPKGTHLTNGDNAVFQCYLPSARELLSSEVNQEYRNRELGCAGISPANFTSVWDWSQSITRGVDQVWEEWARASRLSPSRQDRENFVSQIAELAFKEGIRMLLENDKGAAFEGGSYRERATPVEVGSVVYYTRVRDASTHVNRVFLDTYPEPAMNEFQGGEQVTTNTHRCSCVWCRCGIDARDPSTHAFQRFDRTGFNPPRDNLLIPYCKIGGRVRCGRCEICGMCSGGCTSRGSCKLVKCQNPACGTVVHREVLEDGTSTQRCKAMLRTRGTARGDGLGLVVNECGGVLKNVPYDGGNYKNGRTAMEHQAVGEHGTGEETSSRGLREGV